MVRKYVKPGNQKSTRNLYLFIAKKTRIVPLLVLVIVPICIFVPNAVHVVYNYRIIPSMPIPFTSYKVLIQNADLSTSVKAEFSKVMYLPYSLVILKPVIHLRQPGMTEVEYDYCVQLASIPFVILFLLYGLHPLKYHSEQYFIIFLFYVY
jgi:hypothetical protein